MRLLILVIKLILIVGVHDLYASLAWSVQIATDIRVQSEYLSARSVYGTGVLLEVNHRGRRHLFLATAAHVSQGDHLGIQVDGRDVSPINADARISDGRRDVELIEIENTGLFRPLAVLNNGFSKDSYLGVNLAVSADARSIYYENSEKKVNTYYVGAKYDPIAKSAYPVKSFIIIPSGSYPDRAENLRVGIGQKAEPLDMIQVSLYGDTLFTPASGRVTPGMSGAPLIQSHTVNGKVDLAMEGITIQYLVHGAKSYFADARVVIDLLERYLEKGQRGAINEVRWRASGEALYRTFCLKMNGKACLEARESLPHHQGLETIVTEGGVKGNAGGGVRGDGGGGVRGDGGNDNRGLSRRLSGVVPDWRSVIAPIQVGGVDILGFKVTSKRDPTDIFYIEANWAGVDFVESQRNNYNFELVDRRFSAIDLFLSHFRRQHPEPVTFPFEISYRNFPETMVTVYPDRLELKLPGGKFVLNDAQHSVVREQIYLTIDQWGRWVHTDGVSELFFHPILMLKGDHQSDYYVDIRQLFFLDLSEIPRETELHSSAYHLQGMTQTEASFIQANYQKGSLVNIRSTRSAQQVLVVQIYLPKHGLLDFLVHPLLDLVNPQ